MKLINYLFFFVLFSGCAGNQSIAQEKTKLFITAPSGLKLRAAPNLSSKILGKGTYGQSVQLLEKNVSVEQSIGDVKGHWHMVQLEEKIGYMFGGYLAMEEVLPLWNVHEKTQIKLDSVSSVYLKEIPNSFKIPDGYYLFAVFQDKINDKYLKHYRSDGNGNFIDVGNLVVTNEGYQIELGPLVDIRGYDNGLILAVNQIKKTIIHYNSKLEFIKSKKLHFVEGAVRSIGHYGHFLESNEHELWGTTFNLYDKNFQLLNSIQPYEGKPFKYSFIKYHSNKIYLLVSTRLNNPTPKLIGININDGKILVNTHLDYLNIKKGGHINDLIITNTNLLVPCFNNYTSFDLMGEYLWSIENTASKIVYNATLNSLLIYAYDTKVLTSIDMEAGKELWHSSLSKYSRLNNTVAIRIEPIIDNFLVMLNDGNTRQSQEMVIIDRTGNTKTYFDLSGQNIFDDIYILKEESSKIQLINEKSYFIHE